MKRLTTESPEGQTEIETYIKSLETYVSTLERLSEAQTKRIDLLEKHVEVYQTLSEMDEQTLKDYKSNKPSRF
jgi:uncharacterized protein YaaN involved in tellurite resistance